MIKRRYFMFVRRIDLNDPNNFSTHEQIVTYTSWFADPIAAFEKGRKDAMLVLTEPHGGSVMVEAFNPI